MVKADLVFPIPSGLITEQAAVMGGAGLTALRGLSDVLRLQAGESIVILGASGGVGHLAVQLAKGLGARVLAVASGSDGVSLVNALGADAAADGHSEELLRIVAEFAPRGLDAALLTAGGKPAEQLVSALRPDGRAAYPNGVEFQPPSGKRVIPYNGDPDHDILTRLNDLIDTFPFDVHLSRTFPLDHVADAHRALDTHHVGKVALRINDESARTE